jgi:G2/mitotic-specific cyclin 3/4
MLAVGGIKAAAKRTAFGDVSNTARTLTSAHDDSVVGKQTYHEIVKPAVPQEKSAAFLRPAQRPLNTAASKAPLSYSATSSELIPTVAPLNLLSDYRQYQPDVPANKRTLSKKGTTVYKDTSAEHVQPQTGGGQVARPESAPAALVHQGLGPRQHKSQQQLKQEQPVLRRAQSKLIGIQGEPSENVIPSDPIYEDAQEEPCNTKSDETYESYMKMLNKKEEESSRENIMPTQDITERHRRSLPPPPLVSEPEEYWEDEEEEIYDEQGYTTAHSYRSRGDNTTGGATTILFPKVTNKARKEIAAAKELVESSRTQEEIEDEAWDTSMVAEYGDEIFAYMRELEVKYH